MNQPPTLPSSTATSRRPDSRTIILRLRLPQPALPPPHPASTARSGATHELESVPPATATATTATATPATATATTATATPATPTTATATADPLGDLWGEMFLPDLVRQVAFCLRFSRKDVETMRAVCPAWREAVPSTIDPFLVLSRKKPDVDSELMVMKVKRSKVPEGACFEMEVPFSPPPVGVSCWGSALGLMALQCPSPRTREILVYCLQCGKSKELLPLPMEMIPRALFLEPLTPQRFILMAQEEVADGSLYVDSYGFPWPMEEGGPWWLQAPGFGNIPLRTMALDPGVVRAGADRETIIIIDETGRPIDDEAQIKEIQLPPLLLSDGSSTSPWEDNGQHLILCSGKMYLLQIFDSPHAPENVAVRLLVVEKNGEEYMVTPSLDIGNYSVYLGSNQSFVLPAVDRVIGRLANTVYVEDYRGSFRRPQALAINIQTLSTASLMRCQSKSKMHYQQCGCACHNNMIYSTTAVMTHVGDSGIEELDR